jgi:hypothetical protein
LRKNAQKRSSRGTPLATLIDKMKKTLTTVTLVFALVACGSGQTGSSSEQEAAQLSNGNSTVITAITPTASSDRDNYDQETNFCDYILFHKTEALVLIDYNFFPAGTDVCQQVTYDAELNPEGDCKTAKTVVLPCGFEEVDVESDDMLSVSVSAPTGTTTCETSLVLDVSSAEFTIDGLAIPFTDSLDIFANSLGFKITRSGIVDAATSEILVFDSKDFGLEEIVSEIQ